MSFSAQGGALTGASIAVAASTASIGTTLATRSNVPAAPVPSRKTQTDSDAFDVVGRCG